MKAFALIRMAGGSPDLPAQLWESGEPFNFVLCDRIAGTSWGAYLVAARPAVLQALDGYAGFVGIVAVTESGDVHWGELDDLCADVVRQRINTWLAAHGYPEIPEGWSNRRVVREIYERANAHFDLGCFDILGVED